MLAAALPAIAGMPALTAGFIASLLLGAGLLLTRAPRAALSASEQRDWRALLAPLAQEKFRWLLAVFAINGVAAAIPATLFLFFATDRLQMPHHAGLFLIAYFMAAAVALPLWARISAGIGETRAWLIGMLLSVAVFVWAYQLEAGAALPFAVICVLSGVALGADLRARRRVLRSVDLHDQDESRAGRGHRAASAVLAGLCAGTAE